MGSCVPVVVDLKLQKMKNNAKLNGNESILLRVGFREFFCGGSLHHCLVHRSGRFFVIAPEILDGKVGHSYEVDIWSLGVIMYCAALRISL